MSQSTIKMLSAKSQNVSNGTYLTRVGKIVTLNGLVSLPYTIPEEYRPANYLFAPAVVRSSGNQSANYVTISSNGKITYGDAGSETDAVFISATWLI